MSLLNFESYGFINVFYLVLFVSHVCVDDVIKRKGNIYLTKVGIYTLFLKIRFFSKEIFIRAFKFWI